MHRIVLPLAVATTFYAARAGATYSVTAVDMTTHEVGGAGASCVPYDVSKIYAGVPARGAVNAQAEFDASALALASRRLSEGVDARGVLAEVTSPAVFPRAASMQWGIVDVKGNLARATGAGTIAYSGDLEGRTADGRFAFTTQGNILTSSRVLERASASLRSSAGCDLAEKLVLALEAAGSGGEGDNRCTSNGVPAKSAYVEVTGVSGTIFRVSTPDVSPGDPTPLVRRAFDQYRAQHPCSTPAAPAASSDSAGCACSAPRSAKSSALLHGTALLASLAMRRRRRAALSPTTPGRAGDRVFSRARAPRGAHDRL